ncbi:MAG: copper homeostasis protein CutC [Bacteroidota bacterium]
MLVEVCANSLESALNAEKAGADRIELCTELGVGGITPSHGLITEVKKRLKIPIHVLIRPRSGDFSYSNWDFEVMKNDIAFCKSLGVDGIVAGVLHSDFSVDVERMETLVDAAESMKFTFHRAFDWISNPLHSIKQIEELGIDYVLTSGKENSAEKGLELLMNLNEVSKTVTVMAGGGIKHDNCIKFKKAGLTALHLSGVVLEQSMNLGNKISMNSSEHLKEDRIAVTNKEMVRQIIHSVK